MTGQPRTPGRHRAGLPPATVYRRLWDDSARAEAERLDQSWRGWSILYGAHSRRFYAIAAWSTREPLMVDSNTPEALEERMHQSEMSAAWHALPAPLATDEGAR
ncbi:hypothetical protein ACFV0L_18425 [Streptosporangium canum]|uniref:hypothetical protein n=1 Tax=Streptosporangium canum TaxID=324952 RepID=UPI003685AD50